MRVAAALFFLLNIAAVVAYGVWERRLFRSAPRTHPSSRRSHRAGARCPGLARALVARRRPRWPGAGRPTELSTLHVGPHPRGPSSPPGRAGGGDPRASSGGGCVRVRRGDAGHRRLRAVPHPRRRRRAGGAQRRRAAPARLARRRRARAPPAGVPAPRAVACAPERAGHHAVRHAADGARRTAPQGPAPLSRRRSPRGPLRRRRHRPCGRALAGRRVGHLARGPRVSAR